MGWRGTVRSIKADYRKADRAAQKRQKEREKEREANAAFSAVSNWESYLSDLISVHLDIRDAIDWKAMNEKPEPIQPNDVFPKTESLQGKKLKVKPGLLTKLRGGEDRVKKSLDRKIEAAKASDIAKNEARQKKYLSDLEEWDTDRKMSKKVLSGDPTAFAEVLSSLDYESDEKIAGTEVSYDIRKNFVHAFPVAHTDEIVPKYRLKQLKSGKLSKSDMPKSQFNDLYQDYICSVALKTAGDVFHVLPVEEVLVTAQTMMRNTQTGHVENTPILSARITRSVFGSLNLSGIDPSDCIKNFEKKMSFKKTTGFSKIEPLK